MSEVKKNSIEGVNFYEAIQAHVLWTLRLNNGDDRKARELLSGDYASCSQKVKMNLARLGLDYKKG